MYKIQFIGNLNQSAEFASRWRRELASNQVEAGKKLSKQIKESYNLSDKSSVPGKTLSPRDRQQNLLRERIYEEKDKAKRSRKENKVNNDPVKPLSSAKSSNSERSFKLDQLRERAAKRKPPISQTGTSSNQASRILGNAKKFIGKNKLGIGLAGAAALGGIGYGIARKLRSDKGKKRGFYSR